MQKSLPAAVNDKVVMRSIVNCKLMARYLLHGYHMAIRFRLSMPIFVLPLAHSLEVTRHMDRPSEWPHR